MKHWLLRRSNRPMSCRQVGRFLQRYLDGTVDDLTARRVARHLEACRRCGLEASTYLAIKASLARHEPNLPTDAVRRLRDFGDRLAARELPEEFYELGPVDESDESAGS